MLKQNVIKWNLKKGEMKQKNGRENRLRNQ